MNFKLGIVLSVQPASFTAITHQGNILANVSRMKTLGYDGVELAIRNPNQIDRDDLFNALAQSGLPVPAIGTGQAYGEEGLCFIHEEKSVRDQAIARILSHVPLATAWKAIIIIGLIRGQKAGALSQQTAEYYLESALRETAGRHSEVKFAIEPINRYETDFIRSVDEGLRLIDRLKLENVGLLLDTFHMNIEEPSMVTSIELAGERIFHFHVADSNRWYPGAGHIHFAEILETLDRVRYQHFISAEILPQPDGDTAAQQAILHLRKLLS